MSIEPSLTTKINSAFNYYFMPITPNEKMVHGFFLAFAASAFIGVARSTPIGAATLLVGGAITALAYVITAVAYRIWRLNYAETIGENIHKLPTFGAQFAPLKEIANCGDVDAQKGIGDAYYCGSLNYHPINQNFSKAMRYYQMASKRGSGAASLMLATMYKNGTGVPKDFALSFKYTQLAANQGLIKAYVQLGFMYYHGEGTGRDLSKAFNHFKIVADLSDSYAQFCLGWMYQNGKGCTQDYNKAFSLYKLTMHENVNALILFALLYDSDIAIGEIDQEIAKLDEEIKQSPDGIKKWRQEKAVELFCEAANRGDRRAFLYIGVIYENQERYDEALAMYQEIMEGDRIATPLQAEATLRFAAVLHKQEKIGYAESNYLVAIDMFKELDMQEQLAKASQCLQILRQERDGPAPV